MADQQTTTPRGIAPKGSKAALEAAGWQFTPLPSHNRERGARRDTESKRGMVAIAPAGSGIEPRQHEGAGRAVAWAVEQSAAMAARKPSDVPAGMQGVRLLLGAALASGKVSAGRDDVPERPDGKLLSICLDALSANEEAERLRNEGTGDGGRDPRFKSFIRNCDAKREALAELPELHATTREGLLQKARATLLVFHANACTAGVRQEIVESTLLDLIRLVPTLIDEGRTVPSSPDSLDGVA